MLVLLPEQGALAQWAFWSPLPRADYWTKLNTYIIFLLPKLHPIHFSVDNVNTCCTQALERHKPKLLTARCPRPLGSPPADLQRRSTLTSLSSENFARSENLITSSTWICVSFQINYFEGKISSIQLPIFGSEALDLGLWRFGDPKCSGNPTFCAVEWQIYSPNQQCNAFLFEVFFFFF